MPGKDELTAELVRAARSERDLRKQQRRPSGLLRNDGLRQLLCEAVAENAVRECGEIRTVFLEHPAGEKDDGPGPIERADLLGVQVRDAHD